MSSSAAAAAPAPTPPSVSNAVHSPFDDTLTSLIPISSHPPAASAAPPSQSSSTNYTNGPHTSNTRTRGRDPWRHSLADNRGAMLSYAFRSTGQPPSGGGQFMAMDGINSALPESIRTVSPSAVPTAGGGGGGERTRYHIHRIGGGGDGDGGDEGESAQHQTRRYNT